MTHFIDAPGYSAPAADWKEFLTEMRKIAAKEPNDKDIRRAIAEAEEMLTLIAKEAGA